MERRLVAITNDDRTCMSIGSMINVFEASIRNYEGKKREKKKDRDIYIYI